MIGITFCGLVGDSAAEVEGTLLVEVTCAACKKTDHDKLRFPDPIPLRIGNNTRTHAGVLRSTLDVQRGLAHVIEAAHLYMAHIYHITAIKKIVAEEAIFVATVIRLEEESSNDD